MNKFILANSVFLSTVGIASAFTNLPAYKTAPAVAEAEQRVAAVKGALELPAPDAEPIDKLNVNEFQLKRSEYLGKVVELTFDRVLSLRQEGSVGYVATVTYDRIYADSAPKVDIILPPEGLAVFKPVYELHGGSSRRTSVMVQLLIDSKTRALGVRYRKDAAGGQKYVW